ncbi:MAG: undecaprenyl-phosphate glucose phosphotransferase [Candidatus Auribacterota bacterium]|nr:undecaprenyl-phosphate glucose phosphotransferase [Candidatus Auribacterota bacterium]
MTQIRRYTAIFTLISLISDSLVLFASMLIAFWASFGPPLIWIFPATKGIPPFNEYLEAFPAILVVFLIVFKAFHLYQRKTYFSSTWHFFAFTKAITITLFSLMALTFLYREDFSYSRRMLAWGWIFSIILITLSRRLIDRWEISRWRKNKDPRRILLLGMGDIAYRLLEKFMENPRWGGDVIGILKFNGDDIPEEFARLPVSGMVDEFESVIHNQSIDEVIITRLDLPHQRIMEIILLCEKNLIEVKLVPDVLSIMTSQVEVVNLDGVPLLGLRALPLHSTWNRFIKRILDLLSASVGLVISLPVLLICAAAVKLTSRGPIFYRQVRIGENGEEITIYKLRTMPVDAEKMTGPVLPQRDDPRATPLGSFLRHFSLDELPQFWNVIKGDMSLVGPRPERPIFVEQFKESIPRYMSRHLVKSGLTGWAQVNGLRGDTSIKMRVKYDMYYLENWSLLFDIKIILLTLFSRKVHQLSHRILPLE